MIAERLLQAWRKEQRRQAETAQQLDNITEAGKQKAFAMSKQIPGSNALQKDAVGERPLQAWREEPAVSPCLLQEWRKDLRGIAEKAQQLDDGELLSGYACIV